MTNSRRGAVSRLAPALRAIPAALLVACSGGSAGPGGEVSSPPEAAGEIIEDGIIVCGSNLEEGMGNEWYSLPAMNSKLRHFPEFAEAAGMTSVSNCGEARDLMRRYRDYALAHPGFDAGQPLERKVFAPPVRPPIQPWERTVPKIKGGLTGTLFPVVRIGRASLAPRGDETLSCSGTFIGRNWILTAAHCLQTGNVHNDAGAASKVERWYQYSIAFFDATLQRAVTRDYEYIRQYADSRFLGFNPNQPDHASVAFDAALLYVLDVLDGDLPPGNPGNFMRVSLTSVAIDRPNTETWGWGLPVSSNGIVDLLRRGSLADFSTFIFSGGDIIGRYPATKANGQPFTGPFVCKGDSGGPMVSQVNVGGSTAPVIRGIARTVLPPTPDGGAPPADCLVSTTTGATPVWWNATEENDFIDNRISDWYPDFFCLRPPGSFPTFMQCWGSPCKSDSECSKVPTDDSPRGEYCSRPGSYLAQEGAICTACPTVGDCSCIFGQCLPIP